MRDAPLHQDDAAGAIVEEVEAYGAPFLSAFLSAHPRNTRPRLQALGEPREVVVDRGLRLVSTGALRASVWSLPAPVSRTLVAIHSCSALVCSRHAPWERMSLELAQQASIAANSVAHGVVAAAFLGRTLSLSTFIARRKILGSGGDRRPRIGPRGTPSQIERGRRPRGLWVFDAVHYGA